MNNKILISFLISMIAGLSTLIGCLFIFLKPKNINKFIGISLSFSATIMILISLLELIPDGFFYLSNTYGYIYSLVILILMLFIGYIINILINKKLNKNNNSNLYKVGILSMIALMIHNLPEGILTFLTSTIDIKLGLKLSLAIMMHNIPEGIVIAIPIYYSTNSKYKAIKNTLISGLSEPLGAVLAYLFLYKYISNTMISIILLFVAGIMISLSVNDIYKESKKYSNKYLLIGFIIGLIFIILFH
jgi:ZIP family zinc transporter